jgi:hypothetical protein
MLILDVNLRRFRAGVRQALGGVTEHAGGGSSGCESAAGGCGRRPMSLDACHMACQLGSALFRIGIISSTTMQSLPQDSGVTLQRT